MEKDNLFTTKIKYTGSFSWKELYRILFEWLLDQGYDLSEKSYKEILGGSGAKEVEVEWEAWRKVTDYFRFYMYIKIQIFGLTSVEVEVDGQKVKMNKGQIEIRVKSILEKDYESRWLTRPPIAFLRTMYDRYLIKERTEDFESKLIIEQDEFCSQAKSFLNLYGARP